MGYLCEKEQRSAIKCSCIDLYRAAVIDDNKCESAWLWLQERKAKGQLTTTFLHSFLHSSLTGIRAIDLLDWDQSERLPSGPIVPGSGTNHREGCGGTEPRSFRSEIRRVLTRSSVGDGDLRDRPPLSASRPRDCL